MGLLSNIIDLFRDKPLRMDLIYDAIEHPDKTNLLTRKELEYATRNVWTLVLRKNGIQNGIINKV